MIDVQRALFPILVGSAVVSWVAAVTLILLAHPKPRIAFLVERAVAAVILAVATTIYLVVARNSDLGFALFSSDLGRVIVRLTFIVLGLIPVAWLALYYHRRRRVERRIDRPYDGRGDH